MANAASKTPNLPSVIHALARTRVHENRALFDISSISGDFQGSILMCNLRSRCWNRAIQKLNVLQYQKYGRRVTRRPIPRNKHKRHHLTVGYNPRNLEAPPGVYEHQGARALLTTRNDHLKLNPGTRYKITATKPYAVGVIAGWGTMAGRDNGILVLVTSTG